MGGNDKKNKAVAIALIAVLVALRILLGTPDYLLERSAVSALTYHFFHANTLHLAVNCYALFVLLARGIRTKEIVAAYVIGTLAFFCAHSPTVGMSNILFALMGLRTPSLRSRWWRSTNTIIFLAVMFGYIFVPGVSAFTHIVSFFAGCAVACLARLFTSVNSDYGKAKERKRGL